MTKAWAILGTRERCEDDVLEMLTYAGYETYAPTAVFGHMAGGRKVTERRFIFPGFVFVRLKEGFDYKKLEWIGTATAFLLDDEGGLRTMPPEAMTAFKGCDRANWFDCT